MSAVKSIVSTKVIRMNGSRKSLALSIIDQFGDSIPGGYLNVSRADFLAAVATECNVIVIDRAELPEVTADRGGEFHVGSMLVGKNETAADCRDAAREYLSLAEYLDAHQPVDEADVEALALETFTVFIANDGHSECCGWANAIPEVKDKYLGIARRLLASGKVTVTK